MVKTSRWIAGWAALFLLGTAAAHAATIEDLYQAQTILTGQGEENRATGFVQCLTDVLAKVSGDPGLLDDPRVAALGGQAASFVRAFRYRDRMEGLPLHDEQGTRDRPYDLTVDFHPDKIDAALHTLGEKPWPADRPRVVVFLAVRNSAAAYMLAEDETVQGPGQRESLETAAKRMGLPMALPSKTALAAAGLTVETTPAADPAFLNAAAKAAGGDLALGGSIVFSDEVHGWIVDWRLSWQGQPYRWHVRGVNFDEAFRNGMRGAAKILSGNGRPD